MAHLHLEVARDQTVPQIGGGHVLERRNRGSPEIRIFVQKTTPVERVRFGFSVRRFIVDHGIVQIRFAVAGFVVLVFHVLAAG